MCPNPTHAISTVISASSTRFRADKEMHVRHELWMAKHGRTSIDDADKELRYNIFKQNVDYIESFNKCGYSKYKLGVNIFADQSNENKKPLTVVYCSVNHLKP